MLMLTNLMTMVAMNRSQILMVTKKRVMVEVVYNGKNSMIRDQMCIPNVLVYIRRQAFGRFVFVVPQCMLTKRPLICSSECCSSFCTVYGGNVHRIGHDHAKGATAWRNHTGYWRYTQTQI